MKFFKINHKNVILAFRIVGIFLFFYTVYRRMEQIVSLCTVRPKTAKKAPEIDSKKGILKSLHEIFSPNAGQAGSRPSI